MPCYDPMTGKDDEIIARLACEYCSTLESLKLPIPEWAKDWWERHKKYDLMEERKPTINNLLRGK